MVYHVINNSKTLNIVCNLCKGKNFQCGGYPQNLKWAKREAATQKGSLCLQGRCKREWISPDESGKIVGKTLAFDTLCKSLSEPCQ